MANLNDVLQGLVNLNSKMANNINNLLDSIGEGFLDVGELKVENGILSLQGATILVNGSNIIVENLSTTFTGNRICFLEYKADKSIALKVLSVVDANFNYDLSQLSATSKHFEIARQYNGVLEDRRVASMASKDNTIVGALNGALKAIDYNNEMNLEINMDILSRVSAVESDIVDLDTKKADKTYVDEAVANVDIDGVVTAVDVVEIEGVDVSYVTRGELDEALSGLEVDVDLTPYQEKSDNSLSTTDKTIVGAINELFQSANNGKELIADAIGEPLSSEQTFSAMSSDIDSLLGTFKTNMMNNGITVESSDKFKVLIDKLATLSDNEGKGIQFVRGIATDFIQKDHTYTTVNSDGETVEETFRAYDIELSLDFSPSLIYVHTNYTITSVGTSSSWESINIFDALELQALYLADIGQSGTDVQKFPHFIEDNKYYIPICQFTSSLMPVTACESNWYAIGVGEEDTTLRDSLASILTDEGVSVTEEDDMASLISKVNEEFDNSLKHASGTYTPTSKVQSVDVSTNLSFTPTYFVVNITGIGAGSSSYFSSVNSSSVVLSTDCPNNDWYLAYNNEAGWQQQGQLVLSYSANGFSISGGSTTYRYFDTSTVFTWHAFG